MQQNSLLSLSPTGFHKLAYVEWGSAAAKESIICVHGLTRNGRDFDQLATRLSISSRVVCPDLPGRGASDWFESPHLYNQAQYAGDLTNLIARLNVTTVTWIGTSLGGMIGMYLASQKNSPIKALILNDVGASISKVGLSRIGKYARVPRKFANLQEAEQYLRNVYKGCDTLSDDLWQYKTLHSVIKLSDGSYTLAYDPNISAGGHKFWIFDINLWPLWEKIRCPVLILRGANSDILTQETAERMCVTGPKATLKIIPNCGHTPMLMSEDQIEIIASWLQQIGI